jgi:hypothetical protein
MNKVQPVRFGLDPLRDNGDLRYAAKHKEESGLKFTGRWKCDHFRGGDLLLGGWEPKPNLFTTEGMNYLLDIIFGDTSKAASEIWYVGIFKNNVTPAAGDTGAAKLGSSGDYGECQDPADFDTAETGAGATASTGDKPAFDTGEASSAVISNSSSTAQFTMADSITVYGAFLSDVASCSTPGSAKLMCAKAFSSARSVIDDDVLAVTVQITASSS